MGTLLQMTAPVATLDDYCRGLAHDGTAPWRGTAHTAWLRHETVSMIRFPFFPAPPPTLAERRDLFWRAPAAVLDYLVEPTAAHPANAVNYVLDASHLPLHLSEPARRDIRRAEREFTYAFLNAATLRRVGSPAYCETRHRNGLSDGTAAAFARHCDVLTAPGRQILGAWRGEVLAAYYALIVVDDTVFIEGSFSRDALRRLCPNDGLAAISIDYFLAGGRAARLGYGLSSLQATTNASGLQRFKTKVGFEAQMVRREFAAHPLLRPWLNRATAAVIRGILAVNPRARQIRKAAGVVQNLLG